MINKLNVVAIIVAILTLASCAARKNAEYDKSFKVKKGDIFKLKLESNPSTGYSWNFAEPFDSTVINLNKKEFEQKTKDGAPMMGAGGTEVWIFKAIEKGKTKIKLKYSRSWENDTAKNTKKYIVKVR